LCLKRGILFFKIKNHILTDFLTTGEFDLRNRNLQETVSPAIDILLPSNIERLLYFLTNDPEKIKFYFDQLEKEKYFKISNKIKSSIANDFLSGYCNEQECFDTISNVYNKTGFIIDPHTSVAKNIADRYSNTRSNPILIAATAHYAKFPETVIKALNISFTNDLKECLNYIKNISDKSKFHGNLDHILEKEVKHKTVLDSNLEKIKIEIEKIIRSMKF
jgi:threonine synthase